MMHVCSYSTGISSALSTERVINKYGPEQVYVVFMDTTIEDEDNYRFQKEVYARWRDKGVSNFIYLKDGRTPYQVAEGQHVIPNQKVAPCTKQLKIRQFRQWLQMWTGPITVHIGYDFTEQHRVKRTRESYEKYGWGVDFPLLWRPVESRPYPFVMRNVWGIEPPRMYKMGYAHANCGGVCVKQGWGDWVRTLINFPQRYKAVEEWEKEMRTHDMFKNYALLRDQSEEQVRPKTLEQLRQDHEKKYKGSQVSMFGGDLYDSNAYLDELDSISACVVCGIGDILSDTEE